MGDTSERRQARRQEHDRRHMHKPVERVTDELPDIGGIIRPIPTTDCDLINRMLKRTSIRLSISTGDTNGPARVLSIHPSYEHVGFLVVECDTIFDGRVLLEVGGGVAFALKFQVR